MSGEVGRRTDRPHPVIRANRSIRGHRLPLDFAQRGESDLLASPACDSIARRQTCTIIGVPAMSTMGLPGRREAVMRAGITIRLLVISAEPCSSLNRWQLVSV